MNQMLDGDKRPRVESVTESLRDQKDVRKLRRAVVQAWGVGGMGAPTQEETARPL